MGPEGLGQAWNQSPLSIIPWPQPQLPPALDSHPDLSHGCHSSPAPWVWICAWSERWPSAEPFTRALSGMAGKTPWPTCSPLLLGPRGVWSPGRHEAGGPPLVKQVPQVLSRFRVKGWGPWRAGWVPGIAPHRLARGRVGRCNAICPLELESNAEPPRGFFLEQSSITPGPASA